jgi:hypothetical protein
VAVDAADPGDQVLDRIGQRALGEPRLTSQTFVLHGHRIGEPVGFGFPRAGAGARRTVQESSLPDQGSKPVTVAR